MKGLVKRLRALEGGHDSAFNLLSDEELIARFNENSLQLRPFGFYFPLLDGGPEDAERLNETIKVLRAATNWH